jgi:hypothetical protein
VLTGISGSDEPLFFFLHNNLLKDILAEEILQDLYLCLIVGSPMNCGGSEGENRNGEGEE